MATGVSILAARTTSRAVAAGATEYIDMGPYGFPATVTAVPGAGGTLAISYSTTPGAASLGAGANWIAWPPGTVSAIASATLMSPITGLRAVSATAAGVVEVVG